MVKRFFTLKVRIRWDSGSIVPAYDRGDILKKLLDGDIKFTKSYNGTIYLEDTKQNNKIVGVVEK